MRASWFTGPLFAIGVLVLLPARAYAQHCFESGQPAWAWVVAFGALAFTGASIAVDLFWPTSFLRGAWGAITGRDPLAQIYQGMTGLEAPGGTRVQRWEAAMGMIPVSKVPKAWKTGRRYVDEAIDAWNKMEPSLDFASKASAVTDNVTNFLDAVTGPGDYPVRGGGEQLRADGIRQDDWHLQEAKHGGSPEHSPFRDDSDLPSPVADKIRQQAEDEVYKYGRVIKDPESPYQGLEYITNEEGAKRFYEGLLNKHDVPGHVRVEE